MRYLFFFFLLAGCSLNKNHLPYKNVDGTDLYYEFSSHDIDYNCEYDKTQNNCLCSLKTKSGTHLAWLIRRARENEWCQDFTKNMRKILNESDKIRLLGHDLPSKDGKISELQYFGAIKGSNTCIEWFEKDCNKL